MAEKTFGELTKQWENNELNQYLEKFDKECYDEYSEIEDDSWYSIAEEIQNRLNDGI